MKTIFRLLSFMLLAAIVAGCCNCRSRQRKQQQPLVGTEWQLIQMGGATIQPVEEQYTLQLLDQEQQVAAMGACNRITATYTLGDKQALHIDAPASTRMLCPDAETEAKFIEVLAKTTNYDLDGKMLLLFEKKTLLAVFQVRPTSEK
ncbi:MAG: META domain-containing protein [Alistipes sp.]|nr:META domain-containing protein [Alistipes sp.]